MSFEYAMLYSDEMQKYLSEMREYVWAMLRETSWLKFGRVEN
jgi:hypothetical protein